MTRAVATGGVPPKMDRAMADLVRAASANVRYRAGLPSLSEPLPKEWRPKLVNRKALVDAELAKRDNERLFDDISGLFLRFPTAQRIGEGTAAMMVKSYIDELGELPVWAVIEAIRRFGAGLVDGHNKAFPPSAPEIAVEARKIGGPLTYESAVLELLLEADSGA